MRACRLRRSSTSTQSSNPFSLPYGLSRQTSGLELSRQTSGMQSGGAVSLSSSLTPAAVDSSDELPENSPMGAALRTQTGGSYTKMFREASAMLLPESSLEFPSDDKAKGNESSLISAGNARLSGVNSAESRVSSGSPRVQPVREKSSNFFTHMTGSRAGQRLKIMSLAPG